MQESRQFQETHKFNRLQIWRPGIGVRPVKQTDGFRKIAGFSVKFSDDYRVRRNIRFSAIIRPDQSYRFTSAPPGTGPSTASDVA
jgi:hypothetical protein